MIEALSCEYPNVDVLGLSPLTWPSFMHAALLVPAAHPAWLAKLCVLPPWLTTFAPFKLTLFCAYSVPSFTNVLDPLSTFRSWPAAMSPVAVDQVSVDTAVGAAPADNVKSVGGIGVQLAAHWLQVVALP